MHCSLQATIFDIKCVISCGTIQPLKCGIPTRTLGELFFCGDMIMLAVWICQCPTNYKPVVNLHIAFSFFSLLLEIGRVGWYIVAKHDGSIGTSFFIIILLLEQYWTILRCTVAYRTGWLAPGSIVPSTSTDRAPQIARIWPGSSSWPPHSVRVQCSFRLYSHRRVPYPISTTNTWEAMRNLLDIGYGI